MAPRGTLAYAGIHHAWKVHQNTGGSRHNCYCIRRRGGIPVYNDPSGHLEGLDAVIDKDYAAAKMGRIIRARELWIITDVKYVYRNFGSPEQTPIREITRMETKELYKNGEFQKGSIGPKIRAAMHFLKYHGEKVIITSIPGIKDAFKGNAGTTIRNYA